MKRTQSSRENSPHRTESPETKRLRVEKFGGDNNSTSRSIEATAISGKGRIAKADEHFDVLSVLNEDDRNTTLEFMSTDGSVMAYACASQDCNKRVHDFHVQTIVQCKQQGTPLFPFNNMCDPFFHGVDMNTSVNLYICSCTFLLKNSPLNNITYSILSEFNQLFEQSFRRSLEPWVFCGQWSLYEFDKFQVEEQNKFFVTYNGNRFTLNFETISSRFMSLKFINTYLSSRQVLEYLHFNDNGTNEAELVTNLAMFAKKYQSNEAYSKVIQKLIQNCYESFLQIDEMHPFFILQDFSFEDLLGEDNFDLIKELVISVFKHEDRIRRDDQASLLSIFLNEIKRRNYNSNFDQNYFNNLKPYLLKILKEDFNEQNEDESENEESLVIETFNPKDMVISIIKLMMNHSDNQCFNYEEYSEIMERAIQSIKECLEKQGRFNGFNKILKKIIVNKLSNIKDAELEKFKLVLPQKLTETRCHQYFYDVKTLFCFFIDMELFNFNNVEFNQIKKDLIDKIIKSNFNVHPDLKIEVQQ